MPIAQSATDRTLRSPYGEAAYKVLEALHDAGYDTWWVGGGVRDLLLGHTPKDIDIATEATPEQMKAVFPDADYSPSALGSIRVKRGRHTFELTTFREEDPASDGRHPAKIIFSNREKDAERRDITVNAIYYHPVTRELFDPFEGEKDLSEHLVRFIGDPVTRIRHDALRILRVVRFRATLDGQYHPETYAALQSEAAHVKVLSGSRILEELQKILLCPHPDRALEDLWELRVMQEVLPELAVCKGIPQPKDYHHEGDVWEHALQCTKSFLPEHGIDVRLSALFHDIGKAETFSLEERIRFDHHASVSAEIAEKALGRLQCPVKRREKILWLIKHHMMMNVIDMPDERKAHWYFHPWFTELLQLFWLDIAGTTPSDFSLYDTLTKDYNAFLDSHPRPEKPLLSGEEVMEILGIRPGEKVGELLRALHDAQVQKNVTTRKEAETFLRKIGGESGL